MVESQKESLEQTMQGLSAKMASMAKVLGITDVSTIGYGLDTDNILKMGMFFIRSVQEVRDNGNQLSSGDVNGVKRIIAEIERYNKKTGLFTADKEEGYKLRIMSDKTEWSHAMRDKILESLTGVTADDAYYDDTE